MGGLIESAANKKLKLVRELRQKKHRDREGLFLAEGVRLLEMAVASAWKIRFVLFVKGLMSEQRGICLLEDMEKKGIELYEVPMGLFERVSDTSSPQGILAVMEQQRISLDSIPKKNPPLLVVLDGVQDPGNAGTIIRTADAAGADGIILLSGCVDVFSDKVVRSAMGSIFHLPICAGVKKEDFFSFAQEYPLRLYAAALDKEAQEYTDVNFCEGVALIFGNEGNGISDEVISMSNKFYIPMHGGAESLNVAAASAVAIYEAVRQRRHL